MKTRFDTFSVSPTGPAMGAYAVTPSDTVDLPEAIRAVTIGTAAGTLSFVGLDGVTYTTGLLPIGTYPLFAARIRNTGTTAAGLTGWA